MLHNEECDLYTSPSVSSMTSRSLWWTRYMARLGERRNSYSIL